MNPYVYINTNALIFFSNDVYYYDSYHYHYYDHYLILYIIILLTIHLSYLIFQRHIYSLFIQILNNLISFCLFSNSGPKLNWKYTNGTFYYTIVHSFDIDHKLLVASHVRNQQLISEKKHAKKIRSRWPRRDLIQIPGDN